MISRYIILALTIAVTSSAAAVDIPVPLTTLRLIESEGVLLKWTLLDTQGDDSSGYTFLIAGPDTNHQWLAIGDEIAGLTIYGYENGRVLVSNVTQRTAIGPALNEMKTYEPECIISNQLSGIVQRVREQDTIAIGGITYIVGDIRRSAVVLRESNGGETFIITGNGPTQKESKPKDFEQSVPGYPPQGVGSPEP